MTWNTTSVLVLIGSILIAYLLGSVNFAIIVTKLFKKGDIRDYGSGNAGMTNVLRTVGKGAAALTLLGDFLKGILAVLIMRLLMFLLCGVTDTALLDYFAALAALIGHLFPVFYGFKGGKGILVSAGAMLILSPWSLLLCLAAFLLFACLTRYISAGSLAAGATYPFGVMLVTYLTAGSIHWAEVALAAVIGLSVILMHHANIKRLINGTESKVSFKSKKS